MEQRQEKDKSKILISILLVITVVAAAVTVWALFFRDTKPELTPDYAPRQEEKNAEEIPDDNKEKLEHPEGGSSVSLTYAKEITIGLGERSAALLFANPGKSNQDMVLQILIQDTVIAQSGTLKPGNQIKKLELLQDAEKRLSEGVYEGKFNVLYYDQESGEKAIVNTEIPVTVTVTK